MELRIFPIFSFARTKTTSPDMWEGSTDNSPGNSLTDPFRMITPPSASCSKVLCGRSRISCVSPNMSSMQSWIVARLFAAHWTTRSNVSSNSDALFTSASTCPDSSWSQCESGNAPDRRCMGRLHQGSDYRPQDRPSRLCSLECGRRLDSNEQYPSPRPKWTSVQDAFRIHNRKRQSDANLIAW